jgi:hypothetical protein
MDPLSIALGLAKIVPGVVGFFSGDKAGQKAEKVIGLAKQITGIDDPQEAINAIHANPELQVKMRELTNNLIIAEIQEETKQLQAVNATMQAEAKSEHWMQWSWRPYNGFMFGTTLFFNYAFPPIVNMFIAAFGEESTKMLAAGSIPEFVFVAWASVLGVTSWHRGMQKRVKEGDRGGSGGIMSAVAQRIAGGANA